MIMRAPSNRFVAVIAVELAIGCILAGAGRYCWRAVRPVAISSGYAATGGIGERHSTSLDGGSRSEVSANGPEVCRLRRPQPHGRTTANAQQFFGEILRPDRGCAAEWELVFDEAYVTLIVVRFDGEPHVSNARWLHHQAGIAVHLGSWAFDGEPVFECKQCEEWMSLIGDRNIDNPTAQGSGLPWQGERTVMSAPVAWIGTVAMLHFR